MNSNQWIDLNYLLDGSAIQAEVYQLLERHKLLHILKAHSPILVGTIPIGINAIGSDLDIICEVHDFKRFEIMATEKFKDYLGFTMIRRKVEDLDRIKINFIIENWPIEIFGQNKPTLEQNGYRHMVIEDRMLKIYGDKFKDQIIKLKEEGIKTEPAFARTLELKGDPYLRLLEIYNWNDEELRDLWVNSDDVA